jgi:hypothetical protein
VGSLIGLSLAGIASDHFQKFLICSAYVKPYGLPPGGKIFTVFEAAAATGDENNNVNENINAIDKKIDIATKQVVIVIRFNLSHHNLISPIQKDYVRLYAAVCSSIIKFAE